MLLYKLKKELESLTSVVHRKNSAGKQAEVTSRVLIHQTKTSGEPDGLKPHCGTVKDLVTIPDLGLETVEYHKKKRFVIMEYVSTITPKDLEVK